MPGDDPAEDQIVAHAERGQVAAGFEEFDGVRRGFGQLRREQLARLQQLPDHPLGQVDQAIARGREIEREPEQQVPPLARQLHRQRGIARAQALPIERQVLRPQRAEVGEEGVMGRQVAEQLGEVAPRLPAQREQLILELDLAQHPTHQRIAGERRSLELRHQRHAEDQIFAERGILQVMIALERLDQAGVLRILQALAQRLPRGKHRLDQGLVALRIDHRAQTELEHVVAQLHAIECGARSIHRQVRRALIRVAAQPQLQIFRDGTLGQARRGTDHDHLAGIAGAGDRAELMPVQQQATAGRDGKSSERF